MAVSGAVQALIAAFFFGILFNAASAALVINVKEFGPAIYREGLRLALISFLVSSLSWAFVGFLATLIQPTATSTCQVAVVFSSLFDQFGRTFVEQYLTWAVQKGEPKTAFSVLPQILVVGRFFFGIGFAALTRAQFNPTCVSLSSVRGVSSSIIALDGVIIGLLSVQAFSNGPAPKDALPQTVTARIKTARFVVMGVAGWWGTSVTSVLGFDSIDLFYRTALPGIGLTILISLVTILSQTLVTPRESPRQPDSPVSQGTRDLSASLSTDYPPSRYEDLKETNSVSVSAFVPKKETSRGIKRNEDGTFPTISRPITASGTAVDEIVIREQVLSVVPPLPGVTSHAGRGNMSSARTGMADQWNFITRSKSGGGKLLISNPILREDEDGPNPLKRIATIGLAEAARNERLRREKYGQRASKLVALRPAPRAPSPPPDPATLLMRPEIAGELARPESVKSNETSSGLSVAVNASSTGTQLSPGVEALKRRSPRQMEPLSAATPFKVIQPGEPIRIPIPRPREPDPEPTPPNPVPLKTPLQRRPTTGLPSNPRAQALKTLMNEGENRDPQTVMFVNNIVYDNPDAVGEVVEGASKVSQPPDSGESVVNRPRPISRKGGKDRLAFPAEISHRHTRCKSGASLVSRNSILQIAPGSPTGLPSLPPIPSMTNAVQLNKAKSMTVEEKMELLYSSSSSTLPNIESEGRRRSFVPDIPPIPANLKLQREHTQSPSSDSSSEAESNYDERRSRASGTASVRTSSILGTTANSSRTTRNLNSSLSSVSRNPADEVGKSWLPGISPMDVDDDSRPAIAETRRRSSPVLPVGRQMSTSTVRSDARTVDEESVTRWGSVYSPVVPVMRQNARSTYIEQNSRKPPSFEDVPIVMMDESVNVSEAPNRTSDSGSDLSQSGNIRKSQHLSGQFHHRVGDDCPTFSTRKDKIRSRKMPPPSPLVLSRHIAKRAIVIQPAEPSPVESPTAAYEAIQAQLRKIDRPFQGSTESPNRRIALLNNLEQELGQLESQWQSTHDKLGRDSMSSVPSQDSRPVSIAPPLPEKSSRRSSVVSAIAQRRASQRLSMLWMHNEGGGHEKGLAPPAQVSLQDNLNSTQVQGSGNTPKILARYDDMNILSVSKAMLGSPSPPTTDDSDWDAVSETEDVPQDEVKGPTAPIAKLWSPPVPAQKLPSTSWLWTPDRNVLRKEDAFQVPPGAFLRPAVRKHMPPLVIESSRLWQRSYKLASTTPRDGLWNWQSLSRRLSSNKPTVRPLTIRPPRRSRRISILPDIIEDPQPLPNKRDTLGIFQFPWGERSEHATVRYPSSQIFTAMPGTMTTGRSIIVPPPPESRPRRPEVTEYSSSFFDEYDEDEDSDNFSDFSDSGDDDFDETTLWEIASLLNSDQVPSKYSLLPLPSQSSPSMDTYVLADYVEDIPSDDEHGDDETAEVPIVFDISEVPIEADVPTALAQAWLWAPKDISEGNSYNIGLPQAEAWNWLPSLSEPVERKRSRTRPSQKIDLSLLQSDKLWEPRPPEVPGHISVSLWSAPKGTTPPQVKIYSNIIADAASLWVKHDAEGTARRPGTLAFGVPEFEFDVEVWRKLIAQNEGMKTSKRKIEDSLPTIESRGLWSKVYVDTTPSSPSAGKLWQIPTQSVVILDRIIPQLSGLSPTLWEPAEQGEERSTSDGLFDSRDTRRDFRRTSKIPAAIAVYPKPRGRHEPAPALTSRKLWTASQMPSTVAEDKTDISLWRPKQGAITSIPRLFTIDPERRDYRTTSADPAALDMVRKPRPVQEPLQRLQSNHTWTGSRTVSVEMNWLHFSSFYPASPSIKTASTVG